MHNFPLAMPGIFQVLLILASIIAVVWVLVLLISVIIKLIKKS